MSHLNQTRKNVFWIFCFLFLIVVGIVFLTPISYYSMKPGSAVNVHPLVHVEGKRYPKGGNFLLTTVSLRRGTLFDYMTTKISRNKELIPIDEILIKGESADQYERRQQENLQNSEQNAIIAAFRYAHKPIDVRYEGVEVFVVKRKNSILKQRDIIQRIEQERINTAEELFTYLKKKKVGEYVEIGFLRNKKEETKRIQLIQLPGKENRAGLGIVPITRTHLTTKPHVTITAENMGGPSAGLIFSLEVLNQLLPHDLTKGYQIAGTGTISPDGHVGQIGGMKQKIVAANRDGVHIFFCPKDKEASDQNEKQAKAKVKELHSKMRVVPVGSLKEAVEYLEGMKKVS